jgi:hypothetical protein
MREFSEAVPRGQSSVGYTHEVEGSVFKEDVLEMFRRYLIRLEVDCACGCTHDDNATCSVTAAAAA